MSSPLARLVHSELPVLPMTDAADFTTASEVPWAAVIRKPFRIAALLDALDCAVAATSRDEPTRPN
jgi:hypothetical protein